MARVLISIISEHLIPNYHLFIHLKSSIDKHLFITTKNMEDAGYTGFLKTLIGDEKNTENIYLDDFRDFKKITKNLRDSNKVNPSDKFIVNITGGTKVISLAVFNHFKELDSEIYYVAIGTNSCQKIFPEQTPPETFTHKLTLDEYLSLYGFSIEKSNTLTKKPEFTNSLFAKVKSKDFNSLSVTEIRDAFYKSFTKTAPKDSVYYTGLWFEEYMYSLIKDKLKLNNSQIALNVKVKRHTSKTNQGNDNEFDVMYVTNNKLYVVECKSSIGKKNEHKKNLENFLYKLAAEIKDMGLQVTPILAVTGYPENHKSIIKRADILRIHLVGAEKFNNPILFNTFIQLI